MERAVLQTDRIEELEDMAGDVKEAAGAAGQNALNLQKGAFI